MRNRISKWRKVMLVATAIFMCMMLQPVSAKGNWLSQCLSEGGSDLSDAECYVEYTNRLKREQAGVIKRIRVALSQKGPSETDYPKAQALLNQSQKKWSSFVTTDCAIVTEVFGGGNAVGFAEETCVIEHYKARNAQLKLLEADYLSH
jgi:Lysozyme inhibitor LprI